LRLFLSDSSLRPINIKSSTLFNQVPSRAFRAQNQWRFHDDGVRFGNGAQVTLQDAVWAAARCRGTKVENVLVSLASKEIAMKLVFSTLAFASGAAMAAAATLPVVVGGIAAMCFLFGKRAEARRALDERYARGEINREEYMQRRKDLRQEGY
jgi:Short C-terminal domain